MCSLCSVLGGSRYWTDAAGRLEFERNGRRISRRHEREERVVLLSRVLKHYRLRIQDWGGNAYVLSNEQGKNAYVYNLGGIWNVADELLAQQRCDPLDEQLLEALETTEPGP